MFEGNLALNIEAYDEQRGEVDEPGFARGSVRALFSALLFDGIQTLINHSGQMNRELPLKVRETLQWLESTDSDYIFSFRNVCDGLGVNADFLRNGVLRSVYSQKMKRRRRKGF